MDIRRFPRSFPAITDDICSRMIVKMCVVVCGVLCFFEYRVLLDSDNSHFRAPLTPGQNSSNSVIDDTPRQNVG